MPRLIRALAAIHIDEGSDQIANIHKVSIWMKAQAKFRLLASLDVMRIKMSCSDFFLCLSYFCEQYTNLCPKLQCLFKIKEYCFRVQKLTFHTLSKSKSFHFSEVHNDIFDHMYCIDSGSLLNNVAAECRILSG